MLLCVSGLSAEKVAAILEEYDTPKQLYHAFIEAEEIEGQERAAEEEMAANGTLPKGRKKKSVIIPASLMLTRLGGNGRREIKNALATQLYELFRAQEYVS